jgi:hypothetical protein
MEPDHAEHAARAPKAGLMAAEETAAEPSRNGVEPPRSIRARGGRTLPGWRQLGRVADLERGGWVVGLEQRAQQPVVEFGVEDRDADPFAGELVGAAVGQAVNANSANRWHSCGRLSRS